MDEPMAEMGAWVVVPFRKLAERSLEGHGDDERDGNKNARGTSTGALHKDLCGSRRS